MVGFSANVVQALAESVVLEHAVKGEDEVEESWEPSQQIEAAVLLIPADSGHAVANMGELRL